MGVVVTVGADDGFAFEPAAIRVDAGTTVVWGWTGRGGQHDIVKRDGAFSSSYHRGAGATLTHAFGDPGSLPSSVSPTGTSEGTASCGSSDRTAGTLIRRSRLARGMAVRYEVNTGAVPAA